MNLFLQTYHQIQRKNSHPSSIFTGTFVCQTFSSEKKYKQILFLHRIYQTTLLYRELKLRSSIVSSGQLKLLPKEQLYSNIGGIWNLSSDQGNLGTFMVTNVRVIWYADINETFNISLPYMQIASVSVRLLSRCISNLHERRKS